MPLEVCCCPGSVPMSLEVRYWPGSLPMFLEVSSGALEVCQCPQKLEMLPWKSANVPGSTLEVYFCLWKSANDPKNWYCSRSLPMLLSVSQKVCKLSVAGCLTKALEFKTWSLLLPLEACCCQWKFGSAPWKFVCDLDVTHLNTEKRKTTGTGENPATNKLSFVTSRLRSL